MVDRYSIFIFFSFFSVISINKGLLRFQEINYYLAYLQSGNLDLFNLIRYFCHVKKSISIFFLFTFCFSLSGFSVELHYCKGEVTDISFFGEASCVCNESQAPCVETELTSCKKHCHKEVSSSDSKKTAVKNSCCKTEKLTYTPSKLKAISVTKISEIIAVLALYNPYLILELFPETDQVSANYSPPLLQRDISVLNSVFII